MLYAHVIKIRAKISVLSKHIDETGKHKSRGHLRTAT